MFETESVLNTTYRYRHSTGWRICWTAELACL